MRTTKFSDDNLMQAIAQGDEAAFTMLLKRHRGWVRNLLMAFTHDADHAEDLTQETFCRLLRSARCYCPRGQFTAWLKRIAVNLGRNYLAKAQRSGSVPLTDCEQIATRSRRIDPAALLMDRAIHAQIREAIQALPAEQKQAVLMRYFSGMTLQEIAALLGCPEGTLKSRIHHALRRIRRHIEAADSRE